jgi:AraC-like DNA-binding protein
MIQIVRTEDIRPSVRIANHHLVTPQMSWDRSIPDVQLLCVLEGTFEFCPNHQPVLRLTPGDILFIEPNAPHRFGLASACPAGWITTMHLEFLPAGRWAAEDYRLALEPERVTRLEDSGYIQSRFVRMAEVYESYLPYRKELVNSIASEIVLTLAAHWQTDTPRAAQPSERMQAILGFIRENLAAPINRQSLAETFSLSAGYVNQLFQMELGMPPSAVINRERLARAYQLIDREGLSVAEAALAVGFQDPFYFSRIFKEVYTIPPSQVASRQRRAALAG